jgi:hypothetical protein
MALDSLKAFLTMGFSLVKVVETLADGFQLSDLGPIVSAAKSIPGGLASAPKALGEYLNMNDADALPLEDWVVSNFDVKNETVEVAIETALKLVIELHALARLLVPKV